MGFSFKSLIEVNGPIASSSNCNGSGRANSSGAALQQYVDMTGSAFTFSTYANRFVAVGCKVSSYMESDLGYLVGCSSDCSEGCCNVTIPSNIKGLNATFRSSGKECHYAFIVKDDWFKKRRQRSSSCLTSIQDLDYVPVILEWAVDRSSADQTLMHSNGAAYSNSKFDCYEDSFYSTLTCYCRDGFAGNPYLPNGCQDINECEDLEKNYCTGSLQTCINTNGGYRCYIGSAKHPIKIIIIGVCSGGLGLLLLIVGTLRFSKEVKKRQKVKRKKKFFQELLEQQLSSSQSNVKKTMLFDSKELQKATDNFHESRILGQGGQGTVYKGM